MPITREKRSIRIQRFDGGENSTGEKGLVSEPFATLARNCRIDESGKVIQRLGQTRTGDNPDTLISHYSFDASSSADDKASNDGTDTSISYSTGEFGQAAVFNGTTSLITVAADSTIDITSMGAFVVTCWVAPNSDGEGDLGRIWSKGEHYARVLGESSDTVKLEFVVDYGAGTDAKVITSTTIPSDEDSPTFTKLEFHYNADESLDIYVNGVVASYTTDTTGSGTVYDDSGDDLIIGNNSAASATFDGSIDDFRIYDGTRSADEYEQDKIHGLTRFKVGTTIDKLYRIRDTHLESLDTDFKSWTIENAGDGFTATADTDTNFVQANDRLFILNGVENVHSMDSAESITDEGAGNELGTGTATNPPKGTVGAWAQNNRLFISGHKTQTLRDYVWFSNTLDPQTWNTNLGTGNFFRVQSGSGGAITWLQPFKLNELIIYKEDSIHVLDMTGSTPLTDWNLQPLNTEVGTKAGRTVKDFGNDQIFLDNEGRVRILSRTSFDKLKTSVVDGPIKEVMEDINVDAIEKSCAEIINGRYILSFPTGTNTENDTTVIWDTAAARSTGIANGGWTIVPSDDWNVGYYALFEFGDNLLSLVSSDNRTISLVYKHAGNTDNGSTIKMDIAGPEHSGQHRGSDKIWGPLYVVAKAGVATTLEIFAEIDSGGLNSLGTLSLTGGAPVLPIDLPFNLGGSDKAEALFHVKHIGRGRTCRIQVEHNTYNNNVTMNEYELHWEERITRE